jgi:CheY-like chemotaxis protein
MSEHIAASRAAGCDHHVAKPVIPDTLLRLIAQAIHENAAQTTELRAAG